MVFFGDFHIHSRFSRACSKALTLHKLEEFARIKGLNILGTGDMQHPHWFKEITSHLTEDEHGILWSKNKFPFIWQTEISLIYTQNGKGRRIHQVVLAPNKGVVQQIIEFLGKKGRLDYDGRPIFGISSVEFVDELMRISRNIEIIPAHAWTPHYSVFAMNAGFDSLKDCFQEKVNYIHAIETGLSSDPSMNWRLSQLDGIQMVSNSDSHSFWPWRMGREATIFDGDLTYDSILKGIRTGDGLVGTLEVDPNYGKYHVDGHRNCGVIMGPKESMKVHGLCPKCGEKLTIGVSRRVEELADREEGYKPKGAKIFYTLLPLTELISTVYGIKQLSSKKVWAIYNMFIKVFGNEFKVLLEASQDELVNIVDKKLAHVILLNREGKLQIKPGYDGVYGEVVLEKKDLADSARQQTSLSYFSS
jgi:uncharacterized protein (TIGR00375 family)